MCDSKQKSVSELQYSVIYEKDQSSSSFRIKNTNGFKYVNCHKIKKIGNGTYGTVYLVKVHDPETNQNEIKVVKEFSFGEPIQVSKSNFYVEPINEYTLTEMDVLTKMNHINLLTIDKVCITPVGKWCAMMDYMDGDLTRLINLNYFAENQMNCIQSIMKQIIEATIYLVQQGYMHRDIKLENILFRDLSNSDKSNWPSPTCPYLIKLADFNLCTRVLGSSNKVQKLGTLVQTLNYRSIEILLGHEQYNGSIDTWSIGCVFIQLIKLVLKVNNIHASDSMFKEFLNCLYANDELEQTLNIFYLLGTPTNEQWPEFTKSKYYFPQMPRYEKNDVLINKYIKPSIGEKGLDLLFLMLEYDPYKRPPLYLLNKHPYFT